MRKFHRWLSVLFGVFLLWIAVTGVMSQFAALVANGGFESGERRPPGSGGIIPAARAHDDDDADKAAAFVCPADMICRHKSPPNSPRAWVGWLHQLHSGESFGPAGTIVSIVSGLAMIFFAFSGLWMYIQMFRRRGDRPGQPKWFW